MRHNHYIVFVSLLLFVWILGLPPARTVSAESQGTGESITGDWSIFLPEDSGKQLAVNHCFSCHDLARVVRLRGSSDFWSDLVWSMVSQGADIPREDAEALIKYFGGHLGPNQPTFTVPININTATAEVLQLLSPIANQVDKIVKARGEGKKFEAVEDLLKIDGITKDNFEKIKPFISVK